MAKLLKLTDPLVKQSGMFYSRAIKGTQDGYFLSIEDYEEYLHDHNIEVNDENKVLYLCDSLDFSINVDHAILSALEDHYEDAEDNLSDVQELRDFVKNWCKKQNIKTYFKSKEYFVCLRVPKKTKQLKRSPVDTTSIEEEILSDALGDVIGRYFKNLSKKQNWA